MKNKLTAFIILASSVIAFAEVPQELKEQWEHPALRMKIDAGIKANRMGLFSISFNKPIENLEVRLAKHEFLFGIYASRSVCENSNQSYTKEQIAKYDELIKKVFNYGTVATVWKRIEPEKDKMRWDYSNDKNIDISIDKNPTVLQPDIALAFCEKNDMAVKAHCFSWMISGTHFIPNWINPNGNRADIERQLNSSITKTIQRYGDKIRIWDVVNEAADYVATVNIRFDDYVQKAFKEAERQLPSDHIFLINETTSAWDQYAMHEQTGRFYLLCDNLISKGLKLDAIGLQFHIFSENEWKRILKGQAKTPALLLKALDGYSRLKRPIHITEITIPTNKDFGGEEAQAYYAKNIYELWFSHPNVEAITWWNMRDGQAAPNEKALNGGLIRADLTPKPSYKALEELISKKWQTHETFAGKNNNCRFAGFYGLYDITYTINGKTETKQVWFGKKSPRNIKIDIK